jgi:uncharacterized protein YdhG (YjbR/CyaY superfamily)
MQSSAMTVDEYIDEQPSDWQPTLEQLRAACRRELADHEEGMSYGSPSYSRDGQVEVSFAKQVRYLSLYILKQEVFDAHRDELAGLNLGKGCIRYSRPEQIDGSVVAGLLADTRTSTAPIC